jgi:hypothetical protein
VRATQPPRGLVDLVGHRLERREHELVVTLQTVGGGRVGDSVEGQCGQVSKSTV